MNSKSFVWIGLFIGSTIGGFIPTLWGAGFLSMSGILLSTVGAIAGIYYGWKLSKRF